MKINKNLEAIERLNLDYINLKNDSEVLKGKKIYRFIKEMREGKFKLQLERVKKRNKLKKILESESQYNWETNEWKKLLRNGDSNKKVAVYTCVVGNYDNLNTPYYYADNIDYCLFSDSLQCEGWKNKEITNDILQLKNNSLINRYIKFHPFDLFETDYDYCIYIDGNIAPISDLTVLIELINPKVGIAMHQHASRNCIYQEVKACEALKKGNAKNLNFQIERYQKEGFPENYGMLEGNVIIVDLKNSTAKKLLNAWWNEFIHSESGRDQIAWPYVLWKNGIPVESIATLGKNVYKNPKLRISQHKE